MPTTKAPKSVMKIVFADEEFMANRRETLPSGWWIVDTANNSFFDGPFADDATALERYNRMQPTLRNSSPFEI